MSLVIGLLFELLSLISSSTI